MDRSSLLVALFALCPFIDSGFAAEISSQPLAVHLEPSGAYTIAAPGPGWIFGGSLPSPCADILAGTGADALGSYQELTFSWKEVSPMSGAIRLYRDKPVILFSETALDAIQEPPAPFPDFRQIPKLHLFSYQQRVFSTPGFRANDTSTPWLLFDDQDHAAILSPASHFMIASMLGDGVKRVASGFNAKLRNLPGHFTQQTLFTLADGINHTWDLWGASLNTLRHAERPGNEADTVLRYLGYWTDNGATYYYNYDPAKGYAGTLRALVDHYHTHGVPIGYLQLDSWWYEKTFTGPDGRVGKTKQPKLPVGEWNRYGGLLEYKADPAVFPNGLPAFHAEVGLPLVTHNRWIDPTSDYHRKYKISGVAAVDPSFWDEIGDYLHQCGIETYEQDWLDEIYRYSPEFSSNPDTGAAFVREMARACAARGISIQYCMPYPCYFMEGSQYKNLTTIRVSDDRFTPARWHDFFYTSRLASALGIWPWTDVFMSSEAENMLLSVLSAGPVGIGDPIGMENKTNLSRAVRKGGVIVKPDAACVPLDQCYIRDASGNHGASSPLMASTYTDHHGLRTSYLFGYNRDGKTQASGSFTPAELGFHGDVYIYEAATGIGTRAAPGDSFTIPFAPGASHFYAVAPVGPSGIALLGDIGKFVGTGKERIANIVEDSQGMAITALLSATETSVTLHGYASKAPAVSVQDGKAGRVQFDFGTGHFTVTVQVPPARTAAAPSNAEQTLVVNLKTR